MDGVMGHVGDHLFVPYATKYLIMSTIYYLQLESFMIMNMFNSILAANFIKFIHELEQFQGKRRKKTLPFEQTVQR